MSYLIFKDQKSFMGYFKQGASPEVAKLYRTLVGEEFQELAEAWKAHEETGASLDTVTEVADACIDTIYTAIGLLHALGLDPQALWDEVQRSNVEKIKHRCPHCDGRGHFPGTETTSGEDEPCPECSGQGHTYEARYREDGKVLKPDGWRPPALRPIVELQLHGKGE